MMCRFWLPDQAATLGSFDPKYSPAAAKSETLDEKIAFKNLLPLLKFTVPASLHGRITKITVTGNNSENVAGNMLCDYSGDEPKVYVFSEFKEEYKYKGGKTSVALTSASGMAAGDYYLAIAPKTYSKGLKVTVTYTDTKTSTRSSSASVTLESGVIYDMGTVGAENYDGPGVALPYVFSFYAKRGQHNELKYVTGTTVTAKTHYQLNDSATGSVFDKKTSGTECGYWSNKYYGQDNVNGKYFTGENTYFITRSWETMLEIYNIRASKGVAALELKHMCETRAQNTHFTLYSIGDYENDVDLLKSSDLSACPSNAHASIRDVANITVCSNNDGAIAGLIEYIDANV
jgi:hypothetical protein